MMNDEQSINRVHSAIPSVCFFFFFGGWGPNSFFLKPVGTQQVHVRVDSIN